MDLTFFAILLLYLVAGIIAGINTGFIGGGGGVITVPILIYSFTFLGYPENASIHTAVGTSLFVIIFNAAASSLVHLKKNIIHHRLLLVMVIFGVVGAVVGGTASAVTAGPIFKKLLAVFLLITAVRFLRASRKGRKEQEALLAERDAVECQLSEREHPPKTFVFCGIIGLFSGFVASFFGIGGGAITIPLGMLLVNFSMLEAICYSTCLMTVCTIVGVVVLAVAGAKAPDHVPYSIGYVNYVAGIIMAVSGTYSAKWAALKVHSMNQALLMRIVTVVIIIAAVGLFIK